MVPQFENEQVTEHLTDDNGQRARTFRQRQPLGLAATEMPGTRLHTREIASHPFHLVGLQPGELHWMGGSFSLLLLIYLLLRSHALIQHNKLRATTHSLSTCLPPTMSLGGNEFLLLVSGWAFLWEWGGRWVV